MRNKEIFDCFLDDLFENAVNAYHKTAQYDLNKEKLEQMDEDCEAKLNADTKNFAEECFELIMEADGQEEQFVYHKGFQDCAAVLKWMGVLA